MGDKYMAVSGLPLKCERHAHNIASLCLDMHEIAKGIVINGRNVEVGIDDTLSIELVQTCKFTDRQEYRVATSYTCI